MTPYIHLFRTSEGFYCYDVNTDCILRIPSDAFEYLEATMSGDTNPMVPNSVKELAENGFLKADHVISTEHPDTDLLEYHCRNRIEGLILQVTQNCNLHCDYCTYSGGYINRRHNDKVMSFETATKAIDFFVAHSKDSSRLNLSFYGGEPLLQFDLIRKCVEYIENQVEGKQLIYNFTTNGTLLSDKVVDFAVSRDFLITVSLDGPEPIHDKNRKFSGEGNGSFKTIIKNLKQIKTRYPDYYRKNISFNIVLETDNYNEVKNFFDTNSLFYDTTLMPTLVSDVNKNGVVTKSEQYYEEAKYSHFIACLCLLERLDSQEKSFISSDLISIGEGRKDKHGKQRNVMPQRWHHGGPCIPGVMRLFVDVDGRFFPCEKVSEACDALVIGDIARGYDIRKVEELLNIERKMNGKCFDCWAYSECKMCIGSIGIDETESELEQRCKSIRSQVENNMKDYCVLRSLGAEFEEESDDQETRCKTERSWLWKQRE